MKKLFLFLLALTVTTTAIVAQSRSEANTVTLNAGVEPAREYAEALKKQLGLSDDQTEKVYTARLHYIQKNNRVEKAFSSDPAAMEQQKADLQRDFENTMSTILTPAQLKMWDKK